MSGRGGGNTNSGAESTPNNSGVKGEQKSEDSEHENEESKKEIKRGRTWVSISNKVDKKALNAVIVNTDEDANKVNLEAEMAKYLGGDDEVLKGFYESDEEVQFDSIDMNQQAATEKKSLFGRLSSAIKNISGNKVLTKEEMEPILRQFA